MLKSLGLSIELASALLQSAKKIYESLLGDGVNTTALAHIQVSNFELFGGHFFFFRVSCMFDSRNERWKCFSRMSQ